MSTETTQETQTWYRADAVGDPAITALQVVRETDETVSYLVPGARVPRRSAKVSSWERRFRTEAEAVDFQRRRLTSLLNYERLQVARAETALADFNAAHPDL